MKFKLLSVKTVGGTLSNNNGTFTQHVNISVCVKDCPHDDIKTEKTVPYIFSENLTAKQAEDGIEVFAGIWLNDNYPDVVI